MDTYSERIKGVFDKILDVEVELKRFEKALELRDHKIDKNFEIYMQNKDEARVLVGDFKVNVSKRFDSMS